MITPIAIPAVPVAVLGFARILERSEILLKDAGCRTAGKPPPPR